MSKLFNHFPQGIALLPISTPPADPQNGDFYYDSALVQFRFYQNGAWTALGGGGGGFAYLATNTSAYGGTNSTLSFTGVNNVVIGVGSGTGLTSGHDNTFIGYQAAASSAVSNFSTAVGTLAAGGGIMTGANNSLFGYAAGKNVTSATSLTAIGSSAGGTGVMTGANNTLVGYQAGNALTSGANHVVIGKNAGLFVTTGAQNTLIGANVYSSAASLGGGVTAIGGNAAQNATSSNLIAIGSNAASAGVLSGANNTVIGTNSAVNVTTLSNSIIIGHGAVGTGVLTGADNTVIGYNAANNATIPFGSTIIGSQAVGLGILTGGQNTIIGYQAGLNATALTSSTIIGTSANGTGVNVGDQNTMIGTNSGNKIISGSNNAFLGSWTGFNQTTQNQTVIIGSNAGRIGPIGDDSTVVGYNAGRFVTATRATIVGSSAVAAGVMSGQDNVIMGYGAGNNLTTANRTTIIGSIAAGLGVLDGADNTIIGYSAARQMTTAINSTIIGSRAVASGIMTGNNNTVIGTAAAISMTSANNAVIIGSQAATSGIMTGANNTIIGASAGNGMATGAYNVLIGTSVSAGSDTNYQIAIGNSAAIGGTLSIVIGNSSADNGAGYTVALGQGKPGNAAHTSCFIVGTSGTSSSVATTTAANQISFGTAGLGANSRVLSDMFIGRGAIGDGTKTNISIQPSPMVGTDLIGADIVIRSGSSTGTGVGGGIIFQASQAGSAGTGVNAQTTIMTINSTGAPQIPTDAVTKTYVDNKDPQAAIDLGELTFKVGIIDSFDDASTSTLSTVNYTTNFTDSALLSNSNSYIRINYDASKTIAAATTTTNLNISAVVTGFTAKIGDFAIYGSEVRRITAVASQQSFTVDAFSVAPTLAGQVTISQGIYTVDLNAFTGDGIAAITAYSAAINQILVDYEETTTAADKIFDANTTPVVAYSASADGTLYSPITTRSTNLSDTKSVLNLPSSGTNLYLRFVAYKQSGSGAVNLLKYKTFFQRDVSYADGTLQNQAYCFTNGVGTLINCSAPTVLSSKTRVQVSFTYPVNVNPGTTNGALTVYVNGSKVPRYVDATITPDAYYKEISQNIIELDSDYSAFAYSFEAIQTVAVVDTSDTNTTNVLSMQEINTNGFQAFVNENTRLNPTTTTGTPVAGTFYSSIIGRKSLTDFGQDLKPRMGIERIPTQQVVQLQDEFGPNGESVFAALNDDKNMIRFIGSGWTSYNASFGSTAMSGTNLADYLEITFYGTGLNLLTYLYNGNFRTLQYSLDGGAFTTFFADPATVSSILAGRNYNQNVVIPVVAGQTAGIHTITIKTTSDFIRGVHGLEVLNESTTIKVNPGISYANGKKLTLSSQQSIAYGSTFESGTLGTRGGRVLVYQKSDGTIGKAVTPTNAAQANLTSADHTNEEVVRTYHPREFGAGRTDDFSRNVVYMSPAAFTLDDGTTSLTADLDLSSLAAPREGLRMGAGGHVYTFTFIGTGLDILRLDTSNGGADSFSVTVDGSSIGSLSSTGLTRVRKEKIVSGLPYGTHVVKILSVSQLTFALLTLAFIVYQPKKPILPSGAIELADYNVMANFVAVASAGLETISTGVLRKVTAQREAVYVGNGWAGLGAPGIFTYTGGWEANTPTVGNYVEYTFFGTGFVLSGRAHTSYSASVLVTITGNGRATPANGTGLTIAAVGGYSTVATNPMQLSQAASSTNGSAWSVSGLALGTYTVRFTANSVNTNAMNCLDIITPIHSPKSNLYGDIQNTLPVGSCGISDNRQVTPIKDVLPSKKAWTQAVSITATPSTTSTSPVPMPDMSTIIKTAAGSIRVSYFAATYNSNSNAVCYIDLMVDGVKIPGPTTYSWTPTGNAAGGDQSMSFIVPVSAGAHKVDLYWYTNAGTMNVIANRFLTVEER